MLPNLGPMELMIVMGIAVLLFGKRLPEVGRSLGKGIVEFKKGLRGVEDEFAGLTGMNDSSSYDYAPAPKYDDRLRVSTADSDASVPKFEPPGTPPVPRMELEPQVTPQD
jgi:sec-independent protein translocase protein TatA